jgi:N utilization substance protein B
MKRQRHRAREAALQILYQWEVGGGEVDAIAETFFGLQWPDPDPPPKEVQTFASELARDTVRQLATVDPLIAETTERWRPERMAILDRLILRMAACEMIRDRSTPPAIIIDEALELARTFSTDESVRFINGMLDAIRKRVEQS